MGAIVLFLVIVALVQEGMSSLSSYSRLNHSTDNQKVKVTSREDLTSWAIHKYPGDYEGRDYRNLSALDADVVIHREGGINKVVQRARQGTRTLGLGGGQI